MDSHINGNLSRNMKEIHIHCFLDVKNSYQITLNDNEIPRVIKKITPLLLAR